MIVSLLLVWAVIQTRNYDLIWFLIVTTYAEGWTIVKSLAILKGQKLQSKDKSTPTVLVQSNVGEGYTGKKGK